MKAVTAHKHSPEVTFAINCGRCGVDIDHPETGSLVWGESGFPVPESFVCFHCGATNNVPRGFSRRKPPYQMPAYSKAE